MFILIHSLFFLGFYVFFFQAEDGIRDAQESRGLGDVYKRQGLVKEWEVLKRNKLVQEDQDCIQVPGMNRGKWTRYEALGVWHEHRDELGCSADAPVACRLLAALRAAGVLSVLRIGYSAVGAQGRILPHFGPTNQRYKLHLGVVVPENPSLGCSRLRVVNETRAWEKGKVMLFDDSFEHEVWNDCVDERVVLQVVVSHPSLKLDPRYSPDTVDAHSFINFINE
eukprot:TRINITY_DN20224_c0_g1_i1.p1 TRINITY_DN20224_c0_g1~~TRINITY_DN20224_c0_g1_i1.p1  ORF type:complete len:224 (+),score=27.16 TRINITY_DN20224_c0_g1_i1:29-700(+)